MTENEKDLTQDSEPDTIEKEQEEAPFGGKPTLFITILEDGDVNVGAANQQINLDSAITALELAKTKIIAGHMQTLHEQRKRNEAMTSLTLPKRPSIVRP